MLRQAARWVWDRPGVQLVVGAAIVAFAFPATSAGSIALTLLAAAAGVAALRWWPAVRESQRWPAWLRDRPGRMVATFAVLAIIVGAGIDVFGETLTTSPDWPMGDWGPQHAVLARIMPSLPGFDVPVWNHAVSTGDAPLELYPAFTTLLVGHVAVALGLESDLPLAFMIVAVVVHIAIALLTALLAMRVTSRKVGLVLGLAMLLDGGAISHGGTSGLFRWAILHSAVAQVFSLIAVLGVISALRRPRLAASITVWLATALATATHPSALLLVAAAGVALVGVALLASDIPARRAFIAIGHLAIGVAIGALVWLPASERLLAYGQTFANELYTTSKLLTVVMTFAMPITSFSLLIYAGYLGMIAGLFSRRADVVFVSIVAFAFLLGVCDLPYTSLGLVPGPQTARLGAMRMMMLARPFVMVAAGYLVSLVAGAVRARWSSASSRQRFVAAALLGIAGGVVLRIGPVYWREQAQRAYDDTRVSAPDPDGRRQLVAWARDQMRTVTGNTYGRALFEEKTHEQMHLTALTGLPTLHLGPLPDLLLRERMNDDRGPTLARFNIRWVVGLDRSPTLGDPRTEQVFGTYHVRTIRDWDGRFARVEAGTGIVTVRKMDDRVVEVELDAAAPCLVSLATGYYPRWQAHHESGAAEPVFALPATPHADVHIVSAWLAPGITRFTVDGPLPSDGAGRIPAFAALAIAIAVCVIWSRRRWRTRVLRRAAALRARMRPWLRRAPQLVAPLVVLLLVVRGGSSELGSARALSVGSGLRGVATVEGRLAGGAWQPCDYSQLRGEYDCDGLVTVTDATANVIADAPPSWPFITPAISVSAYGPGVEVRIRRTLSLGGRYWTAASHPATLTIDRTPRSLAPKVVQVVDVAAGDHAVELEARVPFPEALSVAFVAEDKLRPTGQDVVLPPAEPPASVRAIRTAAAR